jgi:hypothetical protein
LPWFLVDRGIAGKGVGDCGEHEWYNHDGVIARCYHCEVGERSWPFATSSPIRNWTSYPAKAA